MQNVIKMALKRLFFPEKIARIAQQLGPSHPGPHNGNLFSRTQSSQPTAFKIVITWIWNKQML